MTKQIINKFHALNSTSRILVILFILAILTVSSMIFAMAASNITFSGQTPASGTVLPSAKPSIGVNVYTPESGITLEDLRMTLDNTAIIPSLTPGSGAGNYTVNYVPAANLINGSHSVSLEVYDTSNGTYETSNWSFTIDASPNVVNLAPSEGGSVETAGPIISAKIKDTNDDLNQDTQKLKIDGTIVASQFQYKGYWAADSCTGARYYVVQSKKEGTISFQAANLADGDHTAELSIADLNGYVLTKRWTFKVGTKPGFSNFTPANSAAAKSFSGISVKVSDESINPDSIILKDNGSQLAHSYNSSTGLISYNGTFSYGNHKIDVSAADANGNIGTATWSFLVDNLAPSIETPGLITRTGDPTTIELSDGILKFNATLKDLSDITPTTVLKLDGQTLPAKISYEMLYDTCSGAVIGIKSKKLVTVNYESQITDGTHTLTLTRGDILGNEDTKTWTVATKPVFTSFTPPNGSAAKSVSGISVIVSGDRIKPESITLKDNGSVVTHTYNSATGLISYNNTFSYGNHTITVSAADFWGTSSTSSWTFLVDNLPPSLETPALSTRAGDPSTIEITNGILKFNATLKDLSDITPNTILKLDGQILPANISYEILYDTCSGAAIGIKSKKLVTVNYEGQISDGTHTLTLTRGDILGNTDTKTWTVDVNTIPVISQFTPVTFLSELSPTISANVKDGNNVINAADIKLTLDGNEVTPAYNSATGDLIYRPSKSLANEAYHSVAIFVYQQNILSAQTTWSFYINTFPDMPDSNMSNCSACHTWNSNATIPFQEIHKAEARFSGNHGDEDECNNCHSYITYPADCLQCHDPNLEGPSAPHGSSPGIKYGLKNYSPKVPFRVTQNREMWDCVICHQPGSPLLGHYWAQVKPTRVLKNHDIPELHKTEISSCNNCHALSLTREHAREGRVDQDGLPITCNTCHKSTDPKVTGAITNHKKNCAECHGQEADHAALHTSALDLSCQECHLKELSAEHKSNPKTTAGKNYTCDTCHQSTDLKVKRTIAASDLSCTDCHKEGHNIYLSSKLPIDIPCYADYQWSNLTEASIFTGDTDIPSGYEDGQVMISNRRNNISAEQVWTFYKTELIAEGWSLKSDNLTSVPATFTAVFEKGTRSVCIKSYDTQISDGSGETTGRRIELWYKAKLD